MHAAAMRGVHRAVYDAKRAKQSSEASAQPQRAATSASAAGDFQEKAE